MFIVDEVNKVHTQCLARKREKGVHTKLSINKDDNIHKSESIKS